MSVNETANTTPTVEMDGIAGWTARIEPECSTSPTAGRHKIAIDNLGEVPLAVEIAASAETEVVAEVAAPVVNIDGGRSSVVELRVSPHERFWNGPVVEHPFTVSITGSDNQRTTLEGLYEQGPRLRPWFLPALVGMLGALLLGTIAWFLLLRPAVEDIAREQAAKLDLLQQQAIEEQVDAIEAAAEEASRLPLGDPTDLRLEVTTSAGTTSTEAFDFDLSGSGRVLSVSDVIFQNPTGAVGRIELLRDDEVLLDQEMANFRDLDFHLVAPLQFNSGSTISLRVTCTTPGPGTTSCEAASTIAGFVDDA